jgi:putative tryptophan/tyrosine transport system substrate-binding protein
MRRRSFLAIVLLTVTLPFASEAQQSSKIAHIGYLGPAAARNPVEDAFEEKLEQLGWVKERNIKIDYRFSGGRQDKVDALAAEIINLGVDVIVAWSPPMALAAKRATTKTPVVFLIQTDPVSWGLVPNYANPGANITGITNIFATAEAVSKYLEFLKEAVPSLGRVAVLVSTERNMSSELKSALTAAAKSLTVELDELEIETPSEIAGVVRKAKDRGAQALFAWGGGFTFSYAKEISDVANTIGLPSIHCFRESALAGGMLAYGADLREEVRRGAVYVDKILKGARAGSLPVEQLSKYSLVLNLKTANSLGVAIPPTLLALADEVIE